MGEYETVETADGLTIGSNTESKAVMQEIAGVEPESTPEETPKEPDKGNGKPEPEKKVDSTGREHDEKGRFKAKPIPDKKEEAEAKEKAEPEQKAEAKPEEKPEEKAEPEKSKKRDARARVEQATRIAAEERRRADTYERENRALREALEARKAPPQPPAAAAPATDPRPELTEGKDPVDYVEELSEWKARQVLREVQEKHQQESQVTRVQERVGSIIQGVEKSLAERIQKEPDFVERLDPRLLALVPAFALTKDDPPANVMNAIAAEIATSSNPPEMMLHLSENEEEVQRLASLSPRELTRAMAKLEGKLEAATTGTPAPSPPPYRPSAAQPVKPVTGAATTAEGPPDVENCTPEEWIAYRTKQERDARRRA